MPSRAKEDAKNGSGRLHAIAASPEAWLAILIVVAFGTILKPSIRGNDGVRNYVYLRSLLIDGNLDFGNEYEYYFRKEAGWFDDKVISRDKDPVTGLPVNLYGVGSSIMWAPFVIAAHGVTRLLSPGIADGYSRPYEWGVSVASCLYASLGLWLLFRMLRRAGTADAAFWTVLATWLATNLVFYMYLHPSMSHANSFFLVSLLLFIYLREKSPGGLRLGWVSWAGMGLVSGLLVATRFQDAMLLLALPLGEIYRSRNAERGFLRNQLPGYAAFCAAAVVGFSPQLFAWWVLQGSPFSGPRGYLAQGDVNLLAPVHALQVLFSSWHGLFFWHPVLLFGLAGLLFGHKMIRERRMALLAFAAQLWIIASWSVWWAGASFGHRMFISTLPFLAFGLYGLLQMTGPRVLWARIVILFLIAWNFGYIVQYGSGMIPRQKGVLLPVLVRNNIVEVPAYLFGLVTR